MATATPPKPPPGLTGDISEAITIGDTPGSPGGGIAPLPGKQYRVHGDPRKEYVGGGQYSFLPNVPQVLPWAIDDVSAEFGHDIYERMMFDGQVNSNTTLIKASVLETGAELTTAIDNANDPDYQAAGEILEFLAKNLDNLVTSLDDTLWNMLDCVPYGNKVAEQIYDFDTTYTGKQQLILTNLKVKPRNSTGFLVDAYRNILGMTAFIPGVAQPVIPGTIMPMLTPESNVLPRAKFAVATFRQVDEDPRGSSILRPAYKAWWLKMQTWPEYLKYLTQFASPSLIGTTAPDSLSVPDPDNPMLDISPEQALLTTLQAFANGTAISITNGATVEPLEVKGDGTAFLHAINLFDLQITKAITTQTLATEQGEHQSRASSQVHQSALYTIVRQAKKSLQRMIRRDILRPLILYNYGPDALHLLPFVTLGSSEETDFTMIAQAIAMLSTSNYLAESQLPQIDRLLGLPARIPGDVRMNPTGPKPPDGPQGGAQATQNSTPTPTNKPPVKKGSPQAATTSKGLPSVVKAPRPNAQPSPRTSESQGVS